MKVNSNIKIDSYLVFLFVTFIFLGIFLGNDFSNYNYLYVILLIIIEFIHFRYFNIKLYNRIFIIFLLFLTVYLFNLKNILYFLLEFVNTIGILILIYFSLYKTSKLSSKTVKVYKLLYFISVIYILTYISVRIIFPTTFNGVHDDRYLGLMGSTNLSSTLICLLIIYIIEYYKRFGKMSFVKILLIFACFFLTFYFTKTRTLLFALPYLFYQCYNFFRFKDKFFYNILFTSTCFLLITFLLFVLDVENITNDLRISKEASYDTRDFVNLIIFDNIKESYYLIPNGFNDAYDLIQIKLGVEKFPVHNDLLKNWNDLGIVFLVVLYFFYIYLKEVIVSLDVKLFLIFLLTLALHNILFSAVVWVPIYFIISLFYLNKKRQNA